MVEVTEIPAERRFVISLDAARVGLLDYRVDGDVFVALHTEVDPSRGGKGLGGMLVGEVLARVRERGLRLRPLCSFVAHYVQTHPECADLVATESRPGGGGAVGGSPRSEKVS